MADSDPGPPKAAKPLRTPGSPRPTGMAATTGERGMGRTARRQEVVELFLRGYRNPDQIADILGMRRNTIAADIQWLIRQWQLHQVSLIANAKTEAIAKLDKLERTAWEGWERSIRDGEITKTGHKLTTGGATGKGGSAADKKENTASVQKITKVGNPQFLHTVRHCIEERNKILGITGDKKGVDGDEASHLAGRTAEETLQINFVGRTLPTFREIVEMIEERAGHMVYQRLLTPDAPPPPPEHNAIPAESRPITIDDPPNRPNGTVPHANGDPDHDD